MAKDTEFLLNHVEWKSDIHLVGCSMGGMVREHEKRQMKLTPYPLEYLTCFIQISQELALIDPTRFSSITLVSTHAGSLPPFEAVWKIPARFMIPTEIGKMKAFVKMLMHPSSLEKSAPEDWSPRHLLSRKNMSRHTSRLYLQKSKSSLSKSSSSSLQTANSSLRPYSSWTMLDKHIDDMLEMKSTVPPMSLKAFARQTAATFTHSVPPNRLAILKKYPDLRILVASGTLDRVKERRGREGESV